MPDIPEQIANRRLADVRDNLETCISNRFEALYLKLGISKPIEIPINMRTNMDFNNCQIRNG
jgi:hypothetical protein